MGCTGTPAVSEREQQNRRGSMKLGRVLSCSAAAFVVAASPLPAGAAQPSAPRSKVIAEIAPNHGEAVERLRQWIALPTIANMNLNHKEGAEHMRQLALDAGFQKARVVPTG